MERSNLRRKIDRDYRARLVSSTRILTVRRYDTFSLRGGNNADRTTGKLTLQDINTTPKELKTEWDVATDSCFSLFGARQYGVTTRENSDEKYPCTLM